MRERERDTEIYAVIQLLLPIQIFCNPDQGTLGSTDVYWLLILCSIGGGYYLFVCLFNFVLGSWDGWKLSMWLLNPLQYRVVQKRGTTLLHALYLSDLLCVAADGDRGTGFAYLLPPSQYRPSAAWSCGKQQLPEPPGIATSSQRAGGDGNCLDGNQPLNQFCKIGL